MIVGISKESLEVAKEAIDIRNINDESHASYIHRETLEWDILLAQCPLDLFLLDL